MSFHTTLLLAFHGKSPLLNLASVFSTSFVMPVSTFKHEGEKDPELMLPVDNYVA
jgi:hypothetical protein